MKKTLVGGYYDDRVFKGDFFDGKTPFNKDIDTYTVEESLELGFVEPVIEWYEDDNEKKWNEISDKEKIEAIMQYTQDDEIAGLVYCESEEAAENYKQEVLQELEELEKNIKYVGMEQNRECIYQEVYEYCEKRDEKIDGKIFEIFMKSWGKDCIENWKDEFELCSRYEDFYRKWYEIFVEFSNQNIEISYLLQNDDLDDVVDYRDFISMMYLEI